MMHFLTIFGTGIIFMLGGDFYLFISFFVGAICIVLACIKTNSVWYEGIARESDAPNRTLYVILPLIATSLAATLNRLFFEPTAWLTGSLVLGIGDAVGEPVGVKFGKHKYKVPGFGKNIRSVEGSFAVFLFSFIVTFGVVHEFWISMFIGLVATLVEAVSPHGFDNYTIHFSVCLAASLMI